MELEEFEGVVEDVVDALPEEFKREIKNLLIVVQDVPDEEQRRVIHLRRHVVLFGLYQGVPLTTPGRDLMVRTADTITIFRLPIIESYTTLEGVMEQIRSTVLHEIGHYFGMSEGQLRELKKKYK